LFEAVETITEGVLSSKKYDQTLECKIVSTENADKKSEYVVEYAGGQFTAYSADLTYYEGEYVYVTIP